MADVINIDAVKAVFDGAQKPAVLYVYSSRCTELGVVWTPCLQRLQ